MGCARRRWAIGTSKVGVRAEGRQRSSLGEAELINLIRRAAQGRQVQRDAARAREPGAERSTDSR
jgi:hypothetical protein